MLMVRQDSVGFFWPEGVPETYGDLVLEYQDFVVKKVSRLNKVMRNQEDLVQEIWTKLIGSRVLEKYVEKASQNLPPTLTAREACQYWGIRVDLFVQEQGASLDKKGAWLLVPLKGGDPRAHGSVYSRDDVERFNALLDSPEGQSLMPRTERRVLVYVGPQGFRAYLTNAIHNHFANWCRTRSRKYRDVLIPDNAVLRPSGSGTFAFRSLSADDGDKRGSVDDFVDEGVDMETVGHRLSHLRSLAPVLAGAGVDLETVGDCEEYRDESGQRRLRPTEEASRVLEVFDHVSRGRSLKDAVQAVLGPIVD